jgi:hypothetical protein
VDLEDYTMAEKSFSQCFDLEQQSDCHTKSHLLTCQKLLFVRQKLNQPEEEKALKTHIRSILSDLNAKVALEMFEEE